MGNIGLYLAALGILLGILMVAYALAKRQSAATAQLVASIQTLQTTPDTTPIPPEEIGPTVVERLEILERRFERLHEESLRYLRQGKSSLSRARQLQEGDYEEEEEEEEEGAALLESVPSSEGAAPINHGAESAVSTPVATVGGRMMWSGLPPHMKGR